LSEGHTPREILQQPWTWRTTVSQLNASRESLEASLWAEEPQTVLFCGAGTSDYVGRSVVDAVREYRSVNAVAVPTTDFIVRPNALFPPEGRVLMAHFARSGDSPESVETLRIGREVFGSRSRHWVVTCNANGALARAAREQKERSALTTLHEATNDQGIAMTSSYSSMTVAGLWLADADACDHAVESLAVAVERVIEEYADTLADVASRGFQRAFYLGTGALEAAAVESALKMQELTRGVVMTKPETFVAFRHGPISAVRDDSLIVGFFSSDPHVRAYEEDLAAQLRGGTRLFVCDEATPALRESGDIVVELPRWKIIPDTHKAPAAVVVGQMLGLFRATALGINADDPSGADGTYSRVVKGVTIHPYRA
jgi:tagatose-6-phosphate ketose/aldose isomerase